MGYGFLSRVFPSLSAALARFGSHSSVMAKPTLSSPIAELGGSSVIEELKRTRNNPRPASRAAAAKQEEERRAAEAAEAVARKEARAAKAAAKAATKAEAAALKEKEDEVAFTIVDSMQGVRVSASRMSELSGVDEEDIWTLDNGSVDIPHLLELLAGSDDPVERLKALLSNLLVLLDEPESENDDEEGLGRGQPASSTGSSSDSEKDEMKRHAANAGAGLPEPPHPKRAISFATFPIPLAGNKQGREADHSGSARQQRLQAANLSKRRRVGEEGQLHTPVSSISASSEGALVQRNSMLVAEIDSDTEQTRTHNADLLRTLHNTSAFPMAGFGGGDLTKAKKEIGKLATAAMTAYEHTTVSDLEDLKPEYKNEASMLRVIFNQANPDIPSLTSGDSPAISLSHLSLPLGSLVQWGSSEAMIDSMFDESNEWHLAHGVRHFVGTPLSGVLLHGAYAGITLKHGSTPAAFDVRTPACQEFMAMLPATGNDRTAKKLRKLVQGHMAAAATALRVPGPSTDKVQANTDVLRKWLSALEASCSHHHHSLPSEGDGILRLMVVRAVALSLMINIMILDPCKAFWDEIYKSIDDPHRVIGPSGVARALPGLVSDPSMHSNAFVAPRHDISAPFAPAAPLASTTTLRSAPLLTQRTTTAERGGGGGAQHAPHQAVASSSPLRTGYQPDTGAKSFAETNPDKVYDGTWCIWCGSADHKIGVCDTKQKTKVFIQPGGTWNRPGEQRRPGSGLSSYRGPAGYRGPGVRGK